MSRLWNLGQWCLAAGVLQLVSCGTSSQQLVSIPPLPAAQTQATLAGPRCSSGTNCTCREPGSDADEGDRAEAPFKRFEVRVGPIRNDLWVTVDGNVLYKSRERASECFYIDLLPGKHPVRIQGHGEDGFAALVQISELSAAGPWYYPSFEFDCGGGGLCDKAGLTAYREYLAQFKKSLHAPCGSTKIRGVSWTTGRMPDTGYPADLAVDLTLDIYEFVTTQRPGSESCSKGAR